MVELASWSATSHRGPSSALDQVEHRVAVAELAVAIVVVEHAPLHREVAGRTVGDQRPLLRAEQRSLLLASVADGAVMMVVMSSSKSKVRPAGHAQRGRRSARCWYCRRAAALNRHRPEVFEHVEGDGVVVVVDIRAGEGQGHRRILLRGAQHQADLVVIATAEEDVHLLRVAGKVARCGDWPGEASGFATCSTPSMT